MVVGATFLVQKQNDKFYAHLSPLYNQTIKVDIEPHTLMAGFPLQLGCEVRRVNTIGLLSSVGFIDESTDQIESYTYTDSDVSEALASILIMNRATQLNQKTINIIHICSFLPPRHLLNGLN